MNAYRFELAHLMEQNTAGLVEARRILPEGSLLSHYADLLYAYLTSDLAQLRTSMAAISHLKMPNAVTARQIGELRLAIRSRQINEGQIEALLHSDIPDNAWRAEALFVCAMAYGTLEKPVRAQACFRNAIPLFEQIGARKKAIRCLLNFVVAESHIHPHKKLLVDYYHVAQKAQDVEEYPMAGLAYLNLSREYQKLGATSVALKHCDQALGFLKEDFGSLHYEHAVAHRAHLLFELGRDLEARIELERVKASSFTEIQAAARVLEKGVWSATAKPDGVATSETLTPTWRERLRENAAGGHAAVTLTASEGQLLNFISEQPRDKFEIIQFLYPESTEFHLLDDRLKNLLMRLRKKLPGLVVFENGKYQVADTVFLQDVNASPPARRK